ncbi:MAG TPA: potassium channel family protein [Pyrinomonadaceae bacterium]|jgi:hypothetical protein|nr:potassium channel family protein [Pyrinomonadaceae bacterium]
MLRGLIGGFALVSICVVIHTFGLVLLAAWLIRHPHKEQPQFNITRYSLMLTAIFAVITLLHLIETFVWATFYDLCGHFNDFETSWYFSVSSYTTIGYGDVVLPEKWRMLGGVEGINGVLLCGLSAAFLFGIVNQMFTSRAQRTAAQSSGDLD